MGMGVNIPWVGGCYTIGMGVSIPWVGLSIYHGYGGRYAIDRGFKDHG